MKLLSLIHYHSVYKLTNQYLLDQFYTYNTLYVQECQVSYCETDDVAALVGNLISASGDFTSSTAPTKGQVEKWLSSGCAVIEAKLTSEGYDIPPAISSAVYDWLSDLNTLFAAAKAEMSRVNITLGPGERTRGQVFEQQFWQGLDRLCALDLTLVGLSRTTADKIYVGGTTDTEKDTWEDDTDRVKPRLFRGQFQFPGTIRPDNSTSASDNDWY